MIVKAPRIILSLMVGCSLLLAQPSWGEAHDDENPPSAKDVQELKQQVQELETKIERQDKHLIHQPETRNLVHVLNGMRFGLGVTGIVQGSFNADDLAGEDKTDASVSLDLEVETAIGDQGTVFILVESREGAGLTDEIETLHGINADAVDDDGDFKLTEAWYEHSSMEDRLDLTLGKVDLTNYFDNNAVANDETLQFLADGFVNNIALEFPADNGAGFRLAYSPSDAFEIGFGVGDSDADFEEIESGVFTIIQAAYKTEHQGLEGNYRLYAWQNRSDHTEWKKPLRDHENNAGLGISIDQAFHDTFTGFFRGGIQDDSVSQVDYALSLGGEIQGLIPQRDKDILGVALGYAHLSDDYEDAESPINTDHEQMLEVYYTFHLNKHLLLSPDIQVIRNPAGLDTADTITIVGVRAQALFEAGYRNNTKNREDELS